MTCKGGVAYVGMIFTQDFMKIDQMFKKLLGKTNTKILYNKPIFPYKKEIRQECYNQNNFICSYV